MLRPPHKPGRWIQAKAARPPIAATTNNHSNVVNPSSPREPFQRGGVVLFGVVWELPACFNEFVPFVAVSAGHRHRWGVGRTVNHEASIVRALGRQKLVTG